MNYTEIRGSIKSGDILAFSHKSWGSWKSIKSQIVRMATRSNYSHVATAWVVGDRVFAIEAVIPEVRIYPLSKLGDFYWIPMNSPWNPETEEKALSYVGNPYSQLAAIKAYFSDLGRGNTQECAALAIAIADSDGVDLGNVQTPDAVVLSAQLMGKPLIYVENGGRV